MTVPRFNPSVSFTFSLRLRYPNRVGMFARIAQAISQEGGDLGAVDIVSTEKAIMTRDVSVRARDEDHIKLIAGALQQIPEVSVVEMVDRVFRMHQGGKISIQNKMSLNNRDMLSMAYTPGVARVCMAIAADPAKAHQFTIKQNAVAVVSDGSAVLGLGNIGPEAAMPVMEGKAMLFKEFGDIDAYPICLRTQDAAEIVQIVRNIAVGFGGINLEDISAPRCFEVEEKLQAELDIPVFHDDQHGTAIVVLAALLNALHLTGGKLPELRIVISGAGAAGVAISKMLLNGGARDIIVCDRQGPIHPGRLPDLNSSKAWLANHTNPRGVAGGLEHALTQANLFIGVSGPNQITARHLQLMAPRPIVFALANPVPEIMPEEAAGHAFIIATGRSDYPNQINNVLAFPGIFRGALNVRARRINDEMKLAAAHTLAACIPPADLSPEYVIPSVFNREVAARVAQAVQEAALSSGATGNPGA